MACPGCGAETRPNQKFCAECGEALRRACPSCGTPYEGSPKFCAECGAGLQAGPSTVSVQASPAIDPGAISSAPVAQAVASAAGAPVAKRKIVSVLFADLVGFTTLAAASYQEAIREWRDLGAAFELAMCELDLVRFVGGERPEVLAAAEEARSIYSRASARSGRSGAWTRPWAWPGPRRDSHESGLAYPVAGFRYSHG
jgi:hypothetical protein